MEEWLEQITEIQSMILMVHCAVQLNMMSHDTAQAYIL